jgi:hypothetical protein
MLSFYCTLTTFLDLLIRNQQSLVFARSFLMRFYTEHLSVSKTLNARFVIECLALMMPTNIQFKDVMRVAKTTVMFVVVRSKK